MHASSDEVHIHKYNKLSTKIITLKHDDDDDANLTRVFELCLTSQVM